MLNTLPDHIRRAAEAVLQPGEVVRWVEKRKLPRVRLAYFVAFGFVVAGMLTLSLHRQYGFRPDWIGTLLVCLGFVIAITSWETFKRARNSAWIITDRRIIDLYAKMYGAPSTIILEPNELKLREKKVYSDGSGHLNFICYIHIQDNKNGPGWTVAYTGFHSNNVAEAEAAIELLFPKAHSKTLETQPSDGINIASLSGKINPDIAEAINTELRSKESIYWLQQPTPNNTTDNIVHTIAIASFISIPISILVGPTIFVLCSFTLFVISLFITLNWEISARSKNKAYLITNMRALEIEAEADGGRSVTTVFPHEFNIREKKARFDKIYTLLFLREGARTNNGRLITDKFGFRRIKDIVGAEKALDRLISSL